MFEKRGWGIKNKAGQVTIFIIIAVVVIGLAVLIYFLSSGTESETSFTFDPENPQGFIQFSLEDEIENTIVPVSAQGGSINLGHTIAYQGNNIEYLCYTAEYYRTCVVQRALLKQHIESEIEKEISDDVSAAFNSLRENYQERGWQARLQEGQTRVELLPKRVIVTMNYVLTASRGGDTTRQESFSVVLNNNLYELISIANSIIEWESTYGDAETTLYMNYYSDLGVEKHKQPDGSTIYILTDRNTGNKFQFASRSVAWPPGYGLEGIAT